MSPGSVGEHWSGVWSRRRADEVSWYEADPSVSIELIERVTDPRDAVVDVGGGASRLVDALLVDGYRDLTVVDVAEASLAQARRRVGTTAAEVHWEVADITRWDPGRSFALWHDRAAFHFLVEAEDRRRYLSVMDAGLGAGGHVVLATFAVDGPESCSGLPVRRYDRAGLAEELGEGFELVEAVERVHRTPTGTDQPFLYGLFRRLEVASGEPTGADRPGWA